MAGDDLDSEETMQEEGKLCKILNGTKMHALRSEAFQCDVQRRFVNCHALRPSCQNVLRTITAAAKQHRLEIPAARKQQEAHWLLRIDCQAGGAGFLLQQACMLATRVAPAGRWRHWRSVSKGCLCPRLVVCERQEPDQEMLGLH